MFTQLFSLQLKSKSRTGSGSNRKRASKRSYDSRLRVAEKLEERTLLAVASLVQTINTYEFSPPSPDPAGIVYLPETGTLLISDSEVNEMSIFTGDNLFESTLFGSLVQSFTTTTFSDEPTGVTLNPENGHLFFSDDTGTRRIYELDPGSDRLYGTDDDNVTSFRAGDFGNSDPEGVAYDTLQGHLFVVDGVDGRVFEVAPGNNGVFDGVAPAGDDQVTSFDVLALGLSDPEGIAFNPENGHLYLVGNPAQSVLEITTEGALVQIIDISAANPKNPAGIVYAPSSTDPNVMSLYIADRGADNDANPDENDGRVYEMSLVSSNPGSVTMCSVAVRDAYINQEHPDENRGSETDLKVKPDAGKERRSLIAFDLDSIPTGSNITDAALWLYEDNHKDNQTVFVHYVTGDWDESQVTWAESSASTSWTTPGGDFDATVIASFAPDSDGVYREIDITSVVQDWVNGTLANYGLMLRSTGANGEVKFKSREEGNSEKQPRLCVTYELPPSGNQAPTVDAGPNQTIAFPGKVVLSATVTDDGEPDPPGAVAITWTQVTGPGTVTFGDPSAVDTTASFSDVGNYVLRLTADDGELEASDDLVVSVVDNTVPVLYFTYSDQTTFPGGVNVDNEDIIAFDGTAYSIVFDGSDVGLSDAVIDAIDCIEADEILMSFTSPLSLPGISGMVDDSDIVKFTATQLGDTTAGTFELYFDGSDVGLETGTEDVDAIHLLDDGRVLISTEGDFSVPQLTGQGEDIIALRPKSLGDVTAGEWSLYFDGNDVGLTGSGVDGVSVGDDGAIYLTSRNNFSVPGLSGKDEDVFVFNPSSLGEDTAGTYDSELLFDGSLHGAGADLKAVDVMMVQTSMAPPIDIRVMGDVPNFPEEYDQLEADLANVVGSDEFFVHLGDIKSDPSPCEEPMYTSIESILQTSSIPVFVVPGDNEWNDCSDPDQAWDYWDAHLMRLDENWFYDFTVLRQAVREENFAFVHSGVLFVGINLVGGAVHDADEWAQRMEDDANWVNENFSNFGSQVTSAVVFGHAFPDPNGGDRQQFAQEFVTTAADFAKPVLYIQGDLHVWNLDHPYDAAPNVTRVVVNRGVPSVRVTITHNPWNPFLFDQSPLMVESTASPQPGAEPLDAGQLAPIVDEAIVRLSHSLGSDAAHDVLYHLLGTRDDVLRKRWRK